MENEINDVKPVSEPSTETPAEIIPQDVKLEEKVEVKEETTPKPAQEKTIPYDRFQEVIKDKNALEEELKKLKDSSISSEKIAELPDFEYMTDSEKWMAKKLIQLEEKTKWEEDLAKAKKSFPDLGDKEVEFKDYCYKFPKSVDVEVLAKSFLFDSKPQVKEVQSNPTQGLEKPTGGSRQSPVSETSLEDVKRLRENQPKLYEKMIREGKLKKIPEK